MGESSKKQEFVTETGRGNLTVYEWKTKNQWRSVVLAGPIHPLADAELTFASPLFSDVGNEAALETFNEPISELDSAWYELDVDEISGRRRAIGG